MVEVKVNDKQTLQNEYRDVRHLLSVWNEKPFIPADIETQYMQQLIESAKFTEFMIDLILEHISDLEHVLMDCDASKEQYISFKNSLADLYKKIEQYKQSIHYTDEERQQFIVNGENSRQRLTEYTNELKEAIKNKTNMDLLSFEVVDAQKLFNRIGILKKVYTTYKNAFNNIGNNNPELKYYIEGSFNSIDLLFMIQKYMTLKNKGINSLIYREYYIIDSIRFKFEELYAIVENGFKEEFEECVAGFYDKGSEEYSSDGFGYNCNWRFHDITTIDGLSWHVHCRLRDYAPKGTEEKKKAYLEKCLAECAYRYQNHAFIKKACKYNKTTSEEYFDKHLTHSLENCFDTIFAEHLAPIITEQEDRNFTPKSNRYGYRDAFDNIGTWKNPLDYINDGINPGEFDEQFKRFVLNVQLPGQKNRRFDELYRENLINLKSLGLSGVDLKREQVQAKAKVSIFSYLFAIDDIIHEFKKEFEQMLLDMGDKADVKQYKETLVNYENLLIKNNYGEVNDNNDIISSNITIDVKKLKETLYTLISAVNNVCKDNKISQDIVSARLMVSTSIIGALIFTSEMYQYPDKYFNLARVLEETKKIDDDYASEDLAYTEFENLDEDVQDEILMEMEDTGFGMKHILTKRGFISKD